MWYLIQTRHVPRGGFNKTVYYSDIGTYEILYRVLQATKQYHYNTILYFTNGYYMFIFMDYAFWKHFK